MRLVARGISKRFGATRAVSAADLSLAGGEIHAIVGENGAGKSTLLKICAGVLDADAGEVDVDGTLLEPLDATTALARGVALVQQHLALVGPFTGLENIVLGVEPTRSRFGVLDLASAIPRIQAVAKDLGWDVPLDRRIDALGLADRQRIAIVRALYREAQIVILDEPTAVLTPAESEKLYLALRRLAEAGRAIAVVTHKLDEVLEHVDTATVLRRGEVRGRFAVRGADRDRTRATLMAAVMGDEPPPSVERRTRALGEPVLEVQDVHLSNALQGVSFVVRASEILGIAGVEGNGQRELVDVLAGRVLADRGAIKTATSESSARPATVFEDRHVEGLVLDASIADNAVLGELPRFTRFGVVDLDAMETEARKRLERAKAQVDPQAPARVLSGGNQQKIVMGRALARVDPSSKGTTASRVLVLAHPTRGVDLGASRAIHAEIARAADSGIGVVIVSADLAELRTLADRCLVLVRGRVVAELPARATDAEYGAAMLEGA